jgi:GNAT superfamily N-acetyltransferase
MAITIRPAEPRDESRWRELWAAYNAFYEHELPEPITRSTWSRILDPASPIHGIVAETDDGTIVGIANYVLHAGTWSVAPVCYLEDMYVDADRRAAGVGTSLIDWLIAQMKAQGWSLLYWVTKENNYRARALYDRYVPHGGFVRYVIENDAVPR